MNPDQRLAGQMLLGEVSLIEAWAREIEPEFDGVVERLETRLAQAGPPGLSSAVLPPIAFLAIVGRRVSPCLRASVSISDGDLDESKLRRIARIAAMAETFSSSIERGGLRHFDDPVDAVKVVAGLLFACAAVERLYLDGRGIFRALRSAKIIANETQELDGFGRPVEGSEFSSTDSRFAGLRPLADGVAVLATFSVFGWQLPHRRRVDPLPTRLAAAVDETRDLPGECWARGIGHVDAVLKCAQPPFE